MSPLLTLTIIIAYFGILFAISYFSGRKANNAGFFSGNRQSSWYLVAFSTIGAAISGVTFVSVPGMVATANFSYMQMVLGFAVGQFINAFVLIPLFYRMNLTSIYEYLENRFGVSSYKTGAWLFFISKMLGAAIRLYIVCVVLQLLVFTPLHIPFAVNVLFTVGLVWLYKFFCVYLDGFFQDFLPDCLRRPLHLLYRKGFGNQYSRRHHADKGQ